MSEFSEEVLKLESKNLVCICMISYCVIGLITRLTFSISPFIYPFFLSFQGKFV